MFPRFGVLFQQFRYIDGWVFITAPNFLKLGVFWEIGAKSTQFGQNWVFSQQNWYIDGWENVLKIGIEKVSFPKSGKHTPVQKKIKNPRTTSSSGMEFYLA